MIKCSFWLKPLLILSFSFPVFLFSQGLIVNEVSNNGGLEYIELLVVGSAADPTGLVDVTDWIIDDNNGDFTLSGSGLDIRTGHIKFNGSCFTTLNPGDLIIIFNEVNPTPPVPIDETDADGNGVYVLAGNSTCLSLCISLPNASNDSYACGFYLNGGRWSNIGLWNDGDAAQVRQPNGDFFHGFAWGDLQAGFPSFPNAGPTSFNAGTNPALSNFSFICGDYTTASNFIEQNVANDTPGAPNSPDNAATIVEIQAGRFDYTNLANTANCGTILSPQVNSFKGKAIHNKVKLDWESSHYTQGTQISIERSHDGKKFESIAKITERNIEEYIDFNPLKGKNIYRLNIIDANGYQYASNNIEVFITAPSLTLESIYPHPAGDLLNLKISTSDYLPIEVSIYDIMGRKLLSKLFVPSQEVFSIPFEVKRFESGTYILKLTQKSISIHQKWSKE